MKSDSTGSEDRTIINKGAYCLIMNLARDKSIAVGVRPPMKFPTGYYCYVGSAMNNLAKRIARHLSLDKSHRWHIDYLLDQAEIIEVLAFESIHRRECAISQTVAKLADGLVMNGFGSSDCRCRTHLHYFQQNPIPVLEKILKNYSGKTKPKMKRLG